MDTPQKKANLQAVLTRHNLWRETLSALKDLGLTFDTASPERIRQAGVVAVFAKHNGEPVEVVRDSAKHDDLVIGELAHAIGIIPITERRHYINSSIPYKLAYHAN